MSNEADAKTVKQDAKQELKPRLRFPEFRDAEGWDANGLSNVADFVSDRIPVEEIRVANYVSTENILPDFSGVTAASKLPTVGSVTRFKVNDILVSNIRPYLKKVWASDKDGGASNDVIVIRAKQNLSSQYLPFILKNDSFIAYVMRGAKGVKMPRGDVSLIREYAVAYPSIPEQQKIADCLTSLDELIAAHGEKLEGLKTYEKGLRQWLFPREGALSPSLRFPEFQSDGLWTEKKLGEIADILMCKRIFAEETNDTGGVPFFKIGTLGGKPDAFISRELFNEYKSKYNYPRKGEVLVTCSGTVGKCLPFDGNESYYQDSNIIWIDNPSLEVTNEFLLRIFIGVDWSKLNSTTITRIYGPDLRNLLIRFPVKKSEQQKIANSLSSIDDLITSQAQNLEALKTHKKGLMQQLFPSQEEVEA